MAYHWPADTDFAHWELDVLDRSCPACGRMMHICDHRYRRFHTLGGPVRLVCGLNHCPDPACPGHTKTRSPELELSLALPQMAIGWDVLCWIGHRRFARHMAVVVLPACQLADASDVTIDGAQPRAVPLAPDHPFVIDRRDLPSTLSERSHHLKVGASL